MGLHSRDDVMGLEMELLSQTPQNGEEMWQQKQRSLSAEVTVSPRLPPPVRPEQVQEAATGHLPVPQPLCPRGKTRLMRQTENL